MKIRPLADKVIVQRLEAESVTAGGIVLPDSAKEKPQRGKIVSVGKGKVLEDGSFDLGSDTTLLTGGPFTGGTWAKKPTASSNPWTLFTPVIVNAARK